MDLEAAITSEHMQNNTDEQEVSIFAFLSGPLSLALVLLSLPGFWQALIFASGLVKGHITIKI